MTAKRRGGGEEDDEDQAEVRYLFQLQQSLLALQQTT